MVHFDVYGPKDVETLGGNKYFVIFIDDATKKVWIYLVRSNDQVFQYFIQFHAMVRRETRRKLKCLRSDNESEYTSREFETYCTKNGIKHEKTIPGTPQHNGVAKRMDRTIIERVRCIPKIAKLSKAFWGEATQTAYYLINRSPLSPLNFEVLEKPWLGKKCFLFPLESL